MTNRLKKNQRGSGLIFVVLILVVVSMMIAAFVSLINTETFTAMNQSSAVQTFGMAEGGMEYALKNKVFPNYSTAGSTVALGSGAFEIRTPTYLTAGIDNVVTTIPVDSTANLPNSGRIIIDSELIDYTATTPISFIGTTRGGSSAGNIVFDAQSTGSIDNRNPLTWSHAVGAGSNRMLVVGVSIRGTNAVSSVTYAGTPLTFVGAQNSFTGGRSRVEIWRLVVPAAGANNIVVTFGGNNRVVGGAVSLTGVDQTTPIDGAFVGAALNNTAPSVTINTTVDSAWVVDAMAYRGGPTATVGAGQAQRWNNIIATRITGAGSTVGPKTPAGAVTMSWTMSGAPVAGEWAMGAVAIRPAFTGGVALSILTHEEVY